MCIHECRKKAVMFLKSQCGVLKSDLYFKIINNQTLKKKNKYHVKSIMKDSHKMALDSRENFDWYMQYTVHIV